MNRPFVPKFLLSVLRHPLVLPLLLVSALFAGTLLARKTIAPLGIYRVQKALYEPGNARQVPNSFLLDIVEIYIPWKFYLSTYRPAACDFPFQGALGEIKIPGRMIPGNQCYPTRGVRSNLEWDVFFPLQTFFSFFSSYDLSYWLFLCCLLLAAYFFFRENLLGLDAEAPEKISHAATAAAALFTFSFPVARELQYDGPLLGLPFLFLSLGFLARAFREQEKLFRVWSALSFFFLYLAIFRTTLQGLGIYLLFWALFATIWHGPELKKRWRWWLGGLAMAGTAGVVYHGYAIAIFLENTHRVRPVEVLSLLEQTLRRTGAQLVSYFNFFTGELFFGFDTVDFSKVMHPLGTRERFSYDSNSFFANPFLGLLFPAFFWSLKKRSPRLARYFLWAGLIDFAIILSPLHGVLYSRFHQWWMLTNVCLVAALVLAAGNRPKVTRLTWVALIAGVACLQIAAVMMNILSPRLVAIIGERGTLGFEPGFWAGRLMDWVQRARLLDYYGAVFLASSLLLLWLYEKNSRAFLGVLTISGLLLNTFHYNYPQPRALLEEFRQRLAEMPADQNKLRPGLTLHDNIQLLLNRPVDVMYESLLVEHQKPAAPPAPAEH